MGKRVNEIAMEIYRLYRSFPECEASVVRYLASLEEFQEKSRDWILCADRFPELGKSLDVVWVDNQGESHLGGSQSEIRSFGFAWLTLPPINHPDLDLLRRFKLKVNANSSHGLAAIAALKEALKEMKDDAKIP